MKFKLSAEVTTSAYTVIEADTLEEAIALSENRAVVLGGIGSGVSEDEDWIIDDADGSPQNIKEG